MAFQKTGSVGVGGLGTGFLLGSIFADQWGIHLSSPGRKYSLPKEKIFRMSIREGFFAYSLTIEHTVNSLPQGITFQAFNIFQRSNGQAFRSRLEELGYEIYPLTARS